MQQLDENLGQIPKTPGTKDAQAMLAGIHEKILKADDIVFYPPDGDSEKVGKWFTYQPPRLDQIPRYNLIRSSCRAVAEIILACCPPSDHRSAALRLLMVRPLDGATSRSPRHLRF